MSDPSILEAFQQIKARLDANPIAVAFWIVDDLGLYYRLTSELPRRASPDISSIPVYLHENPRDLSLDERMKLPVWKRMRGVNVQMSNGTGRWLGNALVDTFEA